MEIKPLRGSSEVSPHDDSIKIGDKSFDGFNNEIETEPDKKLEERKRRETWAKDTSTNATRSVYAHVAEMILKIPSYFILHSDYSDSWWAKTLFAVERATGTVGDMFRNSVYGHKDKNGNWDDNVGAEIHTGDNKEHSLGIINYHTQTKGKFLVSLLGLVSPTLANDLEWAVVRALDSTWWRNMGIHLAYGPQFMKSVFGKFFNTGAQSSEQEQEKPPSWEFIKGKITSHFKNMKSSLQQFRSQKATNEDSSERTKSFLDFCQYTDKLVSTTLPVVNCLNIFGDLARPIARRLGIEGISRSTIRVLSAIDKPFNWITYFFRFYLPEKYLHLKENTGDNKKLSNYLNHSDFLLGSIAGDVLDFGLLAVEDRIKDTSGRINDIIEIGRRIKDSASDIYFSLRRARTHEQFEPMSQ